MAPTTREEERQFIADQIAIARRAADRLEQLAAQQARQAQADGPIVRAARALERALGIGR